MCRLVINIGLYVGLSRSSVFPIAFIGHGKRSHLKSLQCACLCAIEMHQSTGLVCDSNVVQVIAEMDRNPDVSLVTCQCIRFPIAQNALKFHTGCIWQVRQSSAVAKDSINCLDMLSHCKALGANVALMIVPRGHSKNQHSKQSPS